MRAKSGCGALFLLHVLRLLLLLGLNLFVCPLLVSLCFCICLGGGFLFSIAQSSFLLSTRKGEKKKVTNSRSEGWTKSDLIIRGMKYSKGVHGVERDKDRGPLDDLGEGKG